MGTPSEARHKKHWVEKRVCQMNCPLQYGTFGTFQCNQGLRKVFAMGILQVSALALINILCQKSSMVTKRETSYSRKTKR